MKTINKCLLLGAVAIFNISVFPSGARGAVCQATVCSGSGSPINVISNCSSYSDSCYNGSRVRTCNTCNSNYDRTQSSTSVSGCLNLISFYTCTSSGSSGGDGDDCDGTCADCASTDWTMDVIGKQVRTTATCNTLTCKCTKKTEYRCAAGYYGNALNQLDGTSGCTKCPSLGTRMGQSAAGTTAITGCYVTGGSDTTGTFQFTSNCYYSE